MKKIILLATGGTISSIVDQKTGELMARLNGIQLLQNVETQVEVKVQNFSIVNSTYLTPLDMFNIAEIVKNLLKSNDVSGVVITHGTSTLEETAFLLDLLIDNSKPVVITGAQRIAGDRWPDGPRNLESALKVAASQEAINKGVMVVFADKIFDGRYIVKEHTSALDAFASGSRGLLGFVYADGIKFYHENNKKTLDLQEFSDIQVDIIKFYTGADKKFFNTAIDSRVKGIVVEGVGLGNVNSFFYEGIKAAREKGIEVVITSRSPLGKVQPQYDYLGGGNSLRKLGVIFAEDLPSPKARLLLMVAFNMGKKTEEIQMLFRVV